MITLRSNQYTKQDYEFLLDAIKDYPCSGIGKGCRCCPSKRACDDLDRLIEHLENLIELK